MKINGSVILSGIFLISGITHAQSHYFNPAFIDGEKGNAADLSWIDNNAQLPPGNYHVNIYVNQQYISSQTLAFGLTDGPDGKILTPCLTPPLIDAMNINLAASVPFKPAACAPLDTRIPGTITRFDVPTLSVHFSVPQRYLQNRPRGYVSPKSWEHGITSAWLNYVFNGSRSHYRNSEQSQRQDRFFTSLSSGLNLGPWRLRDITTLTHGGDSSGQMKHVRTWLQRDLPALRSQLLLGEAWTSNTLFESVGLTGIQIHTDDNMLPSSQRGYAPDIRGIARTRATVTVRQNDAIVYQTSVPAGEFVLNDLYPTASGGDLQVSVEEEDGRITQFTVPFASVPNLLRPGQVKFAAAVGRFRPGVQQDDPLFAQGDLHYGWRYGLTFYGGTQLANRYRSLALGVGQNMGSLGAISVDVSHARSLLADRRRYSGESLRLRYSKLLNDYGTRFNFYSWRFSTAGFYTLSDTTRRHMQSGGAQETENGITSAGNLFNLHNARKARNQLVASQTLGEYGALALSWDRQSYWHTARTTQSLMLSWNTQFRNIAWGMALQNSTRPGSDKRDNILSLNISVPLGSPAMSTRARYSATRAKATGTTHSAGLSGYIPGSENTRYNLMQQYGSQQHYGGDVSLQHQGARANASLGYSYSSQSRYLSYGLSGGAVLHENGLTLSQPLGNTNILIKAPDASHVAIRNHKGLTTDRRGYAVVPYATPYRVNRVELDVISAGEKVEIEHSVAQSTPSEGALSRTVFATRVGMKAIFFVTSAGSALPFGTLVSVNGEKQNTGIVGDNGSVYLSGLPQEGTLIARWGNAATQSCTARYRLEDRFLNPQTGLWSQELICR